MIYFNDKKEAFAYKIDNPILILEDDIWEQFANEPTSWDIVDGEFVDLRETKEFKATKEQEERERINKLTMTALDFIGVLQSYGLTLEQINEYLESNLAVKMQLTYCQNVYCGVAKSLMPITVGDITITEDMVEIAFKIKNGEMNEKVVKKEDEIEEENS